MLAHALSSNVATSPQFHHDIDNGKTVSVLRLLLAIAILNAIYLDRNSGGTQVDAAVWLAGVAYVLYSVVVCLLSQVLPRIAESRRMHWLDIPWASLIVLLSGAVSGVAFLIFLFPILASSIRGGTREGHITLACASAFAATALATDVARPLSELILHTALLIVLGGVSTCWGASIFASRRRVDLLRDITRMSTPKLGTERAYDAILTAIAAHFGACNCILLLRDRRATSFSLRTASNGANDGNIEAGQTRTRFQSIGATAAAPFLALPRTHLTVWGEASWHIANCIGMAGLYSRISDCLRDEWTEWTSCDDPTAIRIAQLLDAHSYISVPVATQRTDGRLYITSSCKCYSKIDALLLSDIAAHAFCAVDELEHIDHFATEAASHERRKIALDLHDTAIQPYIGLAHGLAALQRKAPASEPFSQELEKLAQMTAQVIGELRRYATSVKDVAPCMDQPLPQALQRRAELAKLQYGIDITLDTCGLHELSEKLATDVMQIVSEGLTNIGKHTNASRAAVSLRCAAGRLDIRIENERTQQQLAPSFMPRSISERAALLGGTTRVEQMERGGTAVLVDIPI